MPTQFINCDPSSLEEQRLAEEKKKFSLSVLSWYRHALENHQLDDFFVALHVLVQDRFPPLGLDPKSEEYQSTVLAETDVSDLASCGSLLNLVRLSTSI